MDALQYKADSCQVKVKARAVASFNKLAGFPKMSGYKQANIFGPGMLTLNTQFNKVLELGLGNVCCVMLASFMLYLMFEYPFRRLIEFSLLPFCSADEEMHLHYVRRKANSPPAYNC